MDLGISGLASGFDWQTFIDKMIQVQQQPEQRLKSDQSTINKRNSAYGQLKTALEAVQTRLEKLKEPAFFATTSTSVSDEAIASAQTGTDTPVGQYSFNIIQLASAAKQVGKSQLAAPLNPSNDVSLLTLSTAAFSRPVTGGTFTVNGQQITIATSDHLQDVFDQISTATGGEVTASYDYSTDKITLSSASTIVLGSATDTSNFLQASKLSNNGTGTVSSSGSLASIKTTGALKDANLAVPLSGAGEFAINGVTIAYDADVDSLKDVISRINSSAAGVTASYDSVHDRMVLTNSVTGDVGIGLQDTDGFLAAVGLVGTGATLERGHDLRYTLNGGADEFTSHSNVIGADESGILGLSVTALKEGTVTVDVQSDSASIKQAIKDFIEDYNKLQSLIDTQTASTTDAKGTVTAGILANDGDADEIASSMRKLSNAMDTSGLKKYVRSLNDLGITSGGYDNNLTLSDEDALDDALANHLDEVQSLFTDETNGISVKLNGFIDKTIGDEGTLVQKQDNLTKQSAGIDTQIADMERVIAESRQRMTESFLAMEQAQAKVNQQLQFLSQKFGISTSSS